MKNLLRISTFSSLMLTRIVTILTVVVLAMSHSPRVHAACSAAPTSGCSNGAFTCSVTKSGNTSTYCCGTSAECTAQKANLGNSVSGATGTSSGANGALKVNPESGCSGGINTALGCIPYDTKGFTGALLTFLIGVVGLIAIVVMLVATIMIMTGGANPEQVKKGKELFTGGITGIFFIVFSVTLLRIIAGDIIKLPGF